jgi:hypothetical protein
MGSVGGGFGTRSEEVVLDFLPGTQGGSDSRTVSTIGGAAACLFGTLRGGDGGLSVGTLRVGAGELLSAGSAFACVVVWVGVARPVKTVVSCLRLCTWLSVSGAKGEPGEGLLSARRMSRMPARIRSLDDASGIVSFLGNHDTVSHTRSVLVSQTQTL